MRSQAKIEDPGRVEITITTTMTLKEWEEVREAVKLHKNQPYRFGVHLTQMITKTSKTIFSDTEE
jgi:hypothetical protein